MAPPLLCGTRRGETALAQWSEFEFHDRETVPGMSLWRIPPEHRKGRVTKKRGLVITLPPLAVRQLRLLQELTGKTFVCSRALARSSW